MVLFPRICSLLSVFFCYLRNGELPLHVVWLFWNMVSNRVKWFILMLVARSYRDIRDWLFLIVACGYGRKIWLGVGPIRLMDVIDCNEPVIDGSSREESGEVMSTTGLLPLEKQM